LSGDIVNCGCNRIQVSLQGIEDIHNDIVADSGSFKKVIKNIYHLNECKERNKSVKPALLINCVITRKNADYLFDILQEFESLPVQAIRFLHLIFDEDETGRIIFDDLLPKGEAIDKITHFAGYVLKNKFKVPASFFPPLDVTQIEAYYNDLYFPFCKTCIFPWSGLRLDIRGQLVTCNGFEIGNISKHSLKELWNGDKNQSFRRNLQKIGIMPDCQRCFHRQY
jgi:radical SAM protein with 4Fe4S-binding SPASM domain